MSRPAQQPANPVLASFVIPTRNRAALLENTIASVLRQQEAGVEIEIIVVDNQSTDDTALRVARLAERADCPIRFASMAENRGPARSRNYGASLCRGEYIAFVDSDVELQEGWLSAVLAAFRANPGTGMVAGKVVFASEPDVVYCYGGELSRLGLGWDANQGVPESTLGRSVFRLWAPSASVAVLRSAFLETGGFDEAFFYGYEDSDLGWRLNLAGWQCLISPEPVAVHATTDQIDDRVRKIGDQIVFHYSKNRLRSLIKNIGWGGFCLWVPAALAYSIVDSVLRAPRRSRMRALLWNLRMLPDTLRARANTQRTRRAPDSRIRTLLSKSLFPPEPLQRRLHERRHLHGSRPDPLPEITGVSSGPARKVNP